MSRRQSTTKGFKQTARLLTSHIKAASESRGFAQSRLLTQWAEIAGEDVASVARPVNVSYGKGGLGATLTLLTTGAHAPVLEMQKEQLRKNVNAIYGYNAISRIRITQTAPSGFQDGAVAFDYRPSKEHASASSPEAHTTATHATAHVEDEGLRQALAQLGTHIISKSERGSGL